mgnify:FL=1|jgi:hypothetical protein
MLTVVARAGEEGDRAAFVTGATSTSDAASGNQEVNISMTCVIRKEAQRTDGHSS